VFVASSKETELDAELLKAEKEARRKSQERFLNNLYVRLVNGHKKQKGSKVLKTFEPQRIEGWVPATAQPGGHPSLSVEIQKASLIKTTDDYVAFALGIGHRSKYDLESTLGVQFGAIPIDDWWQKKFESESVQLSDIKVLFFQHMPNYGSGEFYIDERFNRIEIDCWADNFRYGGKGISSWPEKKQLSLDGVNACIEIVDRTIKNAFI